MSSKEEAKQWARKCPLGCGVKLEVRRVSETDEFPQDNEWVQKELRWKADLAEKIAKQAREAANR
ncbi:DGPFAETKE family protein [Mycolicibacterium fortuitum]|uniref:DGPFAETKE family protein n=1 Tax=Mycolicibacterium fortuitum TaxID=1766 RepID=A0A378UVN8_MYCFO|nr:DGPFAETKE family protein [Mycolicibacterium fortuitum]